MNKMYFDDLTKITAPFGLLDDDTQARLREASNNGARVQYFEGEEWIQWTPHWGPISVYRVDPDWKPAPVPMSLDWSVFGPCWVWAAVDRNGRAYAHPAEPLLMSSRWANSLWNYHRIDGLASYRPGTVDWRDSLIQRPEGV